MFAQQIGLSAPPSVGHGGCQRARLPWPKPNPEYSFDLRGLSSLHYLFVVTAAVFNHAKYIKRKLAGGALQQKPLLPSGAWHYCATCTPSRRHDCGPGLCNRHPRSREENDFWQGMAGNGKAMGLSLIFLGKCVL